LISAYSARGLSPDVFRHVLAEHDVVLSDKVLGEFERVLTERFGIPKPIVADFMEELRLHDIVGEVPVPSHLEVIRDRDDRFVVAAAIEGKAEVLVTGDKDILDVRDKLSQIKAMTPREFWESIRKSG
jgi:putative PIN family toxin of toxin-antitoxin system